MINYNELKSAVRSCVCAGLAHFPASSLQAEAARADECAALRQQARSVVSACARAGLVRFPAENLSADEAWARHRKAAMRAYPSRTTERKSRGARALRVVKNS